MRRVLKVIRSARVLVFPLLMVVSTALAQDKPATVIPTPKDNKLWSKQHESLLDRAKEGSIDLLFLGDSITEGWNNNEVWQRYYGPRHAANFGIGGDQIQNVLWRIENGEIDNIEPKVVVLLIGTNNIGDSSAEDIAAGIKAIVGRVREKLPKTRVLLLGVFPRGDGSALRIETPETKVHPKIGQINEKLKSLDDGKMVTYLDIGPKFLNARGRLSTDITPDFLHLSPKGYSIWAEAMEPTLWKLMED